MVSVSVAIPDEFLCPITRELMKEPVIAAGMSLTNIEQNEQGCGNTKKIGLSDELQKDKLVQVPIATKIGLL